MTVSSSLLWPAHRKLPFEVGYGLEPVVPDAIASRVINDVIVPRIDPVIQTAQSSQAWMPS